MRNHALRTSLVPTLLLTAAWLLPGCAQLRDINPWVDAAMPSGTVETASTQRLAEVWGDEPVDLNSRGWNPEQYQAEDGRVTHLPLWWEDPFEDSGSEDGRFAWTAEDYLAMVYSPLRFGVNTIGWPISAVVEPPWTVRCSDGQVSPQLFGLSSHDASPCE